MIGAALLGLGFAFYFSRTAALSAPGDDPSTDPIPELDFDDPAKSMVVRVVFNGREDADLTSASVVLGRARAHVGDPPLLSLELLDKNGVMVEQINAWHPLWAFVQNDDGSESRIILESASGQFVVPFSTDHRTMEVVDVALDQMVISVDLTEPIRDFCEANPDDPDCPDADGEVLSMEVVDPPTEINVSDEVSVTVSEMVVNNGPFGPAEFNVTFNAVAPADCNVVDTDQIVVPVLLGVDAPAEVEATFTIHCSQPSEHTFEFDNLIEPADPNVQDLQPNNDTGDTSLTVASLAQADLAIVDWDLSALENVLLSDLLVSQTFTFSTSKVVHNFGDTVNTPPQYTDPVDANIWKTMEIPAGIEGSVHIGDADAPADIVIERPGLPDEEFSDQPAGTMVAVVGPATIGVHFMVLDLEVSVDREITEVFNVHCLEPSQHTLTFSNAIMAKDEHVLDPDPSNNTADVVLTIECVTPVQINIHPRSDVNPINPNLKGVIPVAVLTTDADEYGLPVAFDAAAIDPLSVRFGPQLVLEGGGGAAESHDRGHLEDSLEMDELTSDGDLDLVLHFKAQETGMDTDTTELCIVGEYTDSSGGRHTFFGCDSVRVVPR